MTIFDKYKSINEKLADMSKWKLATNNQASITHTPDDVLKYYIIHDIDLATKLEEENQVEIFFTIDTLFRFLHNHIVRQRVQALLAGGDVAKCIVMRDNQLRLKPDQECYPERWIAS